jgi:hypothetical protein
MSLSCCLHARDVPLIDTGAVSWAEQASKRGPLPVFPSRVCKYWSRPKLQRNVVIFRGNLHLHPQFFI